MEDKSHFRLNPQEWRQYTYDCQMVETNNRKSLSYSAQKWTRKTKWRLETPNGKLHKYTQQENE